MCKYLHAGGGNVGPVISVQRCADPACPHKRPVPMNQAARVAMTKRGEKFDPRESEALQRFFRIEDQ